MIIILITVLFSHMQLKKSLICQGDQEDIYSVRTKKNHFLHID